MKKRIIALLLVLCLLPAAAALAAEDAAETDRLAFSRAELTGVCVTAEGKLLAADGWNKVIWDLSGETPVIYAGRISAADLSGEPQGRYFDSTERLRAFFRSPAGIAPFLKGWAVADTEANVIRYVTDKAVQTLAGSGTAGKADGAGSQVRFSRPTGLAVDTEGRLYVADTGNGSIRLVSGTGFVSTYVTGLAEPTGLCWAGGSLYVAETGKNRILKITEGKTEVLAGQAVPAEDEGIYYGGFVNGPAAIAEFDHPQGVAVDEDGVVYIADTLNDAVRMLKDGRVYTLAQSEDLLVPPVEPRALALAGGKLYAACEGTLLQLAPEAKAFEDVAPEAWYADYAAEAALRGLVRGTSETTFSPALVTTRAQFVTMLSRLHSGADGAVVIDGETTMEDIVPRSWYAAPARWALDKGIILGMSGSFVPAGELTREQAAVMLRRYAELAGLETAAYAGTALDGFSDAAAVSDWAVEAMQWAVGAGILNGADGALLPGEPTTRAQTAAMLLRFMDVYGL